MTDRDLYVTWACRQKVHDACGGLGFRMMPSGIDIPCQCACHQKEHAA